MSDAMRALYALDAKSRTTSGYPPEFARRVAGRTKRALGDAFGLSNFG